MLWPYYLSNAQGKFLKSDDGWRENGERERQRDVDSVQGSERDADKGSMHSSQIFMCWVTFCYKLMHNQWNTFIHTSMGTLGEKPMASLVPNDDELDKGIRYYMLDWCISMFSSLRSFRFCPKVLPVGSKFPLKLSLSEDTRAILLL